MGRKAVIKDRNANHNKRDKYQELLTDIFKKHGLKKYTMDTIASELKVSKATLYHYFSSKDEMVERICMNLLFGLAPFEQNLKNTALSFEERFYINLELISNTISDMSNTFWADVQEGYPLIWKEVEKFIEYTGVCLGRFYEEGKKAGVFSDVHTAILVEADTMFFNMVSNVQFLEKNNLTLGIALQEYYKMKLYGFLQKK